MSIVVLVCLQRPTGRKRPHAAIRRHLPHPAVARRGRTPRIRHQARNFRPHRRQTETWARRALRIDQQDAGTGADRRVGRRGPTRILTTSAAAITGSRNYGRKWRRRKRLACGNWRSWQRQGLECPSMPDAPFSLRLYRWLLRLYPAGFRENYAGADGARVSRRTR